MTASTGKTSSAANSMEREITIVRIFDAPRDLVFKAWTVPGMLMRWWGPHRFTNPRCNIDLRPGGAWNIVMRSPDGAENLCEGVYEEIVRPERLVFTNNAVDSRSNPLLKGHTTVLFEDQHGKTKMTLTSRAIGLVPFAPMMLQGMEAGWTQSLEKLEHHFAPQETSSTAAREIITTRVFDAPRDLVFKAWTNPKSLAQWWGPDGFRTTIQEMDVRAGGSWRLVMHGPDGRDYQNESIFLEVIENEILSYEHTSPPVFVATVVFEPQGGKTKVTLWMLFDTDEEREKTVKVFGAIEGGKQTFARLAEFLEQQAS